MKNLIMTIAAIFIFGAASAQDSIKTSSHSSKTVHDTVKNSSKKGGKTDTSSSAKKTDTIVHKKTTKKSTKTVKPQQ